MDANAFLTSDCEIPNCRAMCDGVIPALKAARTAFSFPDVKATGTDSACRLRGLLPDAGTFLPRRFCSAITTENNRSRSRSSSRLIALAKSRGRICRGDEVGSVLGDEDGPSGSKESPRPEVCENRSGVVHRECVLFIPSLAPVLALACPAMPRCAQPLAQPSLWLARRAGASDSARSTRGRACLTPRLPRNR